MGEPLILIHVPRATPRREGRSAMPLWSREVRIALLVTLCGLLVLPARAQEWPAREVHVICGFPAGTGIDQLVRHFAERLASSAGKPFVVDNKPGALTTIAGEYVKNARP